MLILYYAALPSGPHCVSSVFLICLLSGIAPLMEVTVSRDVENSLRVWARKRSRLCVLCGKEVTTLCVMCTAQSSDGGESKTKRISDSELEQLVDGILEDNDGNRDGFIDYPEFLLTQRQQQ